MKLEQIEKLVDQCECEMCTKDYIATTLKVLPKLVAVAKAIKAMRDNLDTPITDAMGQKHTVWFCVAPCEYGEAVDDALAALESE